MRSDAGIALQGLFAQVNTLVNALANTLVNSRVNTPVNAQVNAQVIPPPRNFLITRSVV